MPAVIEACYFVDEPPEIDYRDGLFHIVQQIGGCRCERVMRPYVYMVSLRRAAEAARKHRFGSAEILPFRTEFDEAKIA